MGARIRSGRRSLGLTQKQFAKCAAMHYVEVARLEKGRHWPRRDTLLKLCVVLGVTPNDLLSYDKT